MKSSTLIVTAARLWAFCGPKSEAPIDVKCKLRRSHPAGRSHSVLVYKMPQPQGLEQSISQSQRKSFIFKYTAVQLKCCESITDRS